MAIASSTHHDEVTNEMNGVWLQTSPSTLARQRENKFSVKFDISS